MNIIQLKSFLLKGNKWRKVIFGLPVLVAIFMLWLDHFKIKVSFSRCFVILFLSTEVLLFYIF